MNGKSTMKTLSIKQAALGISISDDVSFEIKSATRPKRDMS